MNKRNFRFLLRTAASFWIVLALGAWAAPTSFTGLYTQNFDGIGVSGTTLPAGFNSMAIPGSTGTYTAANPVTAAGIASATNNTQSLTVWNAGAVVVSTGARLYNVGCWDGTSDRALGSDAASTGAQIIELALINNTGTNLFGVTIS